MLIGTRAVGLGGAFAGLAGDPSGLWYNPGGLVTARRPNIQVTTTFIGIEEVRIDNARTERDGSELDPLDLGDLHIIGGSLGGVIGLGKRRPDKTYDHAVAFGLLTPSFRQVRQRRGATVNGTETRYERDLDDTVIWAGAGYGFRASDTFSLGFSAFYVHRSMDRADRVIRLTPTGTFNDSALEVSAGNIVLAVGAHLAVSDQWTLGLTLGAPGIPITASRKQRLTTLEGEDIVTSEEGGYRVPFTARLGGSWVLAKTSTLTADVSFHAPTEYELGRPAGVDVVERGVVINANLGFEYLLIDALSLALGAYTNFTSAPEIDAAPVADALPHIDMFGATLALGYFIEHSLLRVGVNASGGAGHDVIAAGAGFERIDITRWSVQLFIGTTFRY